MELFEQWKKEAVRWKEECKRNRYQKEQWDKISLELMSEDTLIAFRKLKDKGWTHALTEYFDVGTDHMIRWKQRPAPSLDIQYSLGEAIRTLPNGHVLHTLAEKNGMMALWLLRLESAEVETLSSGDRQRLEELSLTLRRFDAGLYIIGSNTAGSFAYPAHEIQLSAFELAYYPVTQLLYHSVMESNPSSHEGASRPVEMVSWFDTLRFCNALSKKKGLQPCYRIGERSFDGDGFETTSVEWDRTANGYRLPLEEEWEVAARTQNEHDYVGSANPTEVGWFRDNSMLTSHAIMQKKVSPCGLYDLNGNVDEWCWNLAKPYDGAESYVPQTNGDENIRPMLTPEALVIENQRRAMLGIPPLFPDQPKEDPVYISEEKEVIERVNRGGGWFDLAEECTVSRRSRFYPTVRDANLGFRLARNV